jgi:hypothetical protein
MMGIRLLAAIDVGLIAQVVWVSLAASIVVPAAFALVVLESGRSAEARRNGDGGGAALHAGLALLFFAAFGAIVAVGVITMLRKS